MSYSANEIMTLAQKAARGAGFPPAQAVLFGRATVQHLATGGEIGALTGALASQTNSPILRLPLVMQDILRALPPAGPEITLTLHPDDVALAESYARLLPLRLKACTVTRQAGHPPRLSITGSIAQRTRATLPARIEAPEPLIESLSRLAAETYVPASAASRSVGAGAGDIDND